MGTWTAGGGGGNRAPAAVVDRPRLELLYRSDLPGADFCGEDVPLAVAVYFASGESSSSSSSSSKSIMSSFLRSRWIS